MALLLLQAHATVTVCHSATRRSRAPHASGRHRGRRRRPARHADRRHGQARRDRHRRRHEPQRSRQAVRRRRLRRRLAVAGWITPVPGGVGPMTITMLLSTRSRPPNGARERELLLTENCAPEVVHAVLTLVGARPRRHRTGPDRSRQHSGRSPPRSRSSPMTTTSSTSRRFDVALASAHWSQRAPAAALACPRAYKATGTDGKAT